MTRAPHPSGRLLWLGHALEFRRDPMGLLAGGRARLGTVFSSLSREHEGLPGAPYCPPHGSRSAESRHAAVSIA